MRGEFRKLKPKNGWVGGDDYSEKFRDDFPYSENAGVTDTPEGTIVMNMDDVRKVVYYNVVESLEGRDALVEVKPDWTSSDRTILIHAEGWGGVPGIWGGIEAASQLTGMTPEQIINMNASRAAVGDEKSWEWFDYDLGADEDVDIENILAKAAKGEFQMLPMAAQTAYFSVDIRVPNPAHSGVKIDDPTSWRPWNYKQVPTKEKPGMYDWRYTIEPLPQHKDWTSEQHEAAYGKANFRG